MIPLTANPKIQENTQLPMSGEGTGWVDFPTFDTKSKSAKIGGGSLTRGGGVRLTIQIGIQLLLIWQNIKYHVRK